MSIVISRYEVSCEMLVVLNRCLMVIVVLNGMCMRMYEMLMDVVKRLFISSRLVRNLFVVSIWCLIGDSM